MNYLMSHKSFSTEKEAAEFVDACEAAFEARLQEVADAICADPTVRLITLSGPSCSGKTTTAKKLISELSDNGKKVHVISIDDFYYDREYLDARAEADPSVEVDYDSVDTIDLPALAKCVRELFSEKVARVPKFDFKEGRRVGYSEIVPSEDDLYIFEGIQAIYPEITALFAEYSSKSVYICAESGLDFGDVRFDPNEIRLLRRLVRDDRFRNTAPEFTMYLWKSVRANEDANIFPYVSGVDLRIDSTMPYDINMLKPYLEKVLATIPENNEFIERARSIIEKVKDIRPISREYLREHSLYHEFI